MQRRNIMLSLAAVLLTACLYYRGGFVLLPIAALPVLVHELSHILALHLLGQRITGFSLDGSGLCIRYDGTCTPAGHILAALAGPLGGAVYALGGTLQQITDYICIAAPRNVEFSENNMTMDKSHEVKRGFEAEFGEMPRKRVVGGY